jgi:polyisoprenyl-teichoic acid--peptidoglycan teichoic acid transferase
MSTGAKPYRRFRARGGSASNGDLDALRELNRRPPGRAGRGGSGSAVKAPPRAPAPAPAGRRPPPPPRPPRPPRALRREGRPWWSLRGLGPGGWAWRIGLVLLVALLAWGLAGFLALRGAVSDANAKVTRSARAALSDPPGGLLGTPTNTLIIGSDARRGETRSRADTILIMRTDPDSGRIKYLSIPRDFRVTLGRLGDQKLNAAFFFGGQAGMIRAVERLTGLPIHHLMVINFRGFPKLVDSLGGVTVNNPTSVVDCYYQAGERVTFRRGDIDLNGERALAFVRVRKCDSDLQRAQRQQALLSGLKGKVLSVGSLYAAPWRGANVVRALTTDIGTIDMMKLGWLQARLAQKPGDRLILPGDTETIGGVSYVIGVPDADEAVIRKFVSSG